MLGRLGNFIYSWLISLRFAVVVLIALWYLGTVYWGISPLLLPNPVKVWAELKVVLATGEFWPDLKVTLSELAIAFAISSISGITIGYLVSRSQYLIKVFEPLFAGIYSVPIILFLPLYVLFFGLGPGSKIALGTTISFFPIVLNTIAGFGYVEKIFVTAARSRTGWRGLPAMPMQRISTPACSFWATRSAAVTAHQDGWSSGGVPSGPKSSTTQ